MPQQRTLKRDIQLDKTDIVSGNPSAIFLYSAPPDTGIVFQTPREQIVACLNNISAMTFPCKTLVLHGKKDRVAVPEHLLAHLYAYEIDNAYVRIEKTPSLTSRLFKYFGSARNTQFVPYFGRDLCDALDGNFKEQGKNRREFRLEGTISTDRLLMRSDTTDNLRIYAKTEYKLQGGVHVKQEKGIVVSPESIREISTARNYCGTASWAPKWLTKAVSCFVFLSHGFGNGNDETNMFYPVRTPEEWYAQEKRNKMTAELACHTIMDRLGELALLQGRLLGVDIYCSKAGHKDAIETLKMYQNRFKQTD